ncbi:MAG: hypothetical protein KY461_01515 [Actinobacteria bacterium]|nr:hypothetical protein [Actinomycetota bacterium]
MSPTTTIPAGPSSLGLGLAADADVDVVDGALRRRLTTPSHLHGPTGILQGGLAAGVLAEAARLADRFGAPLTSIDARLWRPTPLDAELTVEVRQTGAARFEVRTLAGEDELVTGAVEFAGHDPVHRVPDLVELGRVPLPEPVAQDRFPDCWVCGPAHPDGLHLLPAWHAPDRVSIPWIPDDSLADDRGHLHPLVVAAVLDCPTVWAARDAWEGQGFAGALLTGYHLGAFADAPVGEPLRVVARLDHVDGRKIRARSALVDEDGIVYAVASAFHVAVAELPS